MSPPDRPVGTSVEHFLDEWMTWEGPDYGGRCQAWEGDPGLYKNAG